MPGASSESNIHIPGGSLRFKIVHILYTNIEGTLVATRESSSSSAAHRLFCCDPDHSVIQFTVGVCRDSESLSFGAEREHRGSPCCAVEGPQGAFGLLVQFLLSGSQVWDSHSLRESCSDNSLHSCRIA